MAWDNLAADWKTHRHGLGYLIQSPPAIAKNRDLQAIRIFSRSHACQVLILNTKSRRLSLSGATPNPLV